MRVKCISTSSSNDNLKALHYRWLTLDKIYEVQGIDPNHILYDQIAINDNYIIIDDVGNITTYPKHCFTDLQLIRQDKLKQLGI